MAKLFIVGIGPGELKNMTYEAREAIESAEVVVGYKTYLDLIAPLLGGKKIVSSGMTKEVERCTEALALAASGKCVVLVSSGDAGVYGMAGLVLELANDGAEAPEIIIVPGVSAVHAAAAVLGAPLMNDFAVISLSDLLTPWAQIERRLAAAAAADFVVALYNPKSKGRVTQIERAREIFLATRAADTPVGIVRNACRVGEEKTVTTLGNMLQHTIDMFSIVIIGSSATYVDDEGRMVTPRGYEAGMGREAQGAAADRDAGAPRRAVLICGTASDVGKSVLASGLCRILKKRGISVAPFKSQNMALNSAVTPEGGEIGRAQAVQAEACGLAPHTDMNPVLLKPSSETGSQVIVQGKVVGNMSVTEYNRFKAQVFPRVRESFERLAARHRFIVMEGAGSIAEINLKADDIANLKVAEMAGCPALLVADIDRGGVFAQVVGTLELLTPAERQRIRGVIINKFRGDPALLEPGLDFIEKRTGVPVLGVIPWFTGFCLPEEDSVALERKGGKDMIPAGGGMLHIGVVKLPRISNYTDFDPLEAEPDVVLHYIENVKQLSGIDILILPGSKSTTADLFFMMERGLYDRIQQFTGPIVGICGGFQMLGKRVLDPHAIESDIREAQGLGLLDVETTLLEVKETHQVVARLLDHGRRTVAPALREKLRGYEIHMGETTLGAEVEPFAMIVERSGAAVAVADGAVSADGRVFGSYLHGIFDNDAFRTAFLNRIRREKGLREHKKVVPLRDPLDLLATHLEQHLDLDRVLDICGLEH